MRYKHLISIIFMVALSSVMLLAPDHLRAATADELNRNAGTALQDLYAKSPAAKALAEKAVAILVFPSITKGGFLVGGQFGEGALLKRGKPAGYYSTVSISYGLQAGVQKYGYALFFMTNSALEYLDKSDGWELGTGPSIVVVDVGAAKSISTTTAKSDVYAFFFDQKGLMGGLGIQGTKITRINK